MTALAKNVVEFPSLSVIDGGAKLTIDGKVKKTHSNAIKGRSTWVDPIKTIEDVYKVVDYLQSKVDAETRFDYKKAWARNLMYFGIGVFSGFRVSDLLSLTWQDIFEDDGKTYREYVGIIEKKTGKVKQLYITEASKRYINQYVELIHPDTTKMLPLFTNRQGKRMNRQTADDFIKEATTACGLKGRYSTHSIRKTYAYQLYINLTNSGNAFALPIIQKFLNHRNSDTTLRYLGVDRQIQMDAMNDFADAMLAYQEGR